MSAKQYLVRSLSAAFLAGTWSLDGLVERGIAALGKDRKWLRVLARRVLATYAEPSRLDAQTLAVFVGADSVFNKAWGRRGRDDPSVRQIFWVPPAMLPAVGPPATWQVPDLATTGRLADWLGLAPTQLDWFADCRSLEGSVPAGPLRHYTYCWLRKSSSKLRLLERPKRRLKALQRQVLHEILDRIPAHEAAHGYCRGRSIASYVLPHAGQTIVLRLDLRDFFPSIRSSRVHALFRTSGYPHAVARLLTGLCTNVVPDDVWREGVASGDRMKLARQRELFGFPHLPAGAPTSPALANLCAYRLDCRLAALAAAVAARYTRYADDLAFSGDQRFERCVRRFHVNVCRIALEEGFEVHTRKTRFMRQGICQQLAGVVLNVHPNIRRREYDRLKATLHNCLHHGPHSQNREGREDFRAHLAGRIAYLQMINGTRGRRLRALYDRVSWE